MREFIILTRRHILLTIFFMLIAGVLVAGALWNRAYQDRFFPGVFIGNEEVGGKTLDEVLARMRLVGEALKTGGLEITVPTDHTTSTIVIPSETVGLTPDVVVAYFTIGDYEAAIREAFAVGRTGNFFKRTEERFRVFARSHSVQLPIVVRDTAIESLLERELHALLRPATDAYFVRGTAGIGIVPESVGESVEIAPIVNGVHDALVALKTNRLKITVFPVKAQITADRLAAIKEFAEAVSRGEGMMLTYRESTVYVGPMTLASWLTRTSRDQVEIAIRKEALSDFIRKHVNQNIDDRPKNSRFAMRDGILTETVPGTPGSIAGIDELKRLIEDELNARYIGALFSRPGAKAIGEQMQFPIVFEAAPPLITADSIKKYKINELVGSATTSFRGSTASRKHNIATGVQTVSGVLIAPGEEFSLVAALGDVSEEAGYEKEYVIKGDRSVKEAGGGLCQVATTVFRAALNAGLPITERTNHSYVVGYYGPGLDATIYGPWPDLRFVNDTPGYVLFQMRVSGDNLIAEFYGQKDGREASVTTPKLSDYIDPPPDRFIPAPDKPWGVLECTDHARKGLTAEAIYTVHYADGHVNEQKFTSVYQPWPKICLVGIAIPGAPLTR